MQRDEAPDDMYTGDTLMDLVDEPENAIRRREFINASLVQAELDDTVDLPKIFHEIEK